MRAMSQAAHMRLPQAEQLRRRGQILDCRELLSGQPKTSWAALPALSL